MKKEEKEVTWLDTYYTGGYSYKDYLEFCKDNEIEPGEEDGERYWSWIHQQIADDVECFFDNLMYAEDNVKGACVVSGSLGLWDGRHEIEPKEFESLEKAIKACWGDTSDIRAWTKGGVLYVNELHHDGTNCFEIRPKSGEYPMYLY